MTGYPCDYCGRPFSRPSVGCKKPHAESTPAWAAAMRIIASLNDRRGLHIDSLPYDLQQEIEDDLVEIIRQTCGVA